MAKARVVKFRALVGYIKC